jgi:hypothetical protein
MGGPRERQARSARNLVNPRVGCRMQQACGLRCGENRRGGEEPRGRNERSAWQRFAEAERLAARWEWTHLSMPTEGRSLDTTL